MSIQFIVTISGACVAPSTRPTRRVGAPVRGAFPSHELCSLNVSQLCIIYWFSSLFPLTTAIMTYCAVACVAPSSFRISEGHRSRPTKEGSLGRSFVPNDAGLTGTKKHLSVFSSFVPALNLFQGDHPSCFGSSLDSLTPALFGFTLSWPLKGRGYG